MPILPPEPDLFPADLWTNAPAPAGPDRWLCLHTKPRQEKATARLLYASRIAYYLPQTTHESRTPAGRKIRSIRPLFPSYVFMRGTDEQRVAALRGDTLANVLEVPEQAALVADLHQIHQMLASGLAVGLEPTHPVGVRVRITSGPLLGLVGTVTRRGPRDRFVASINFLGCGGVVDLEDWQVERVDEPPTHSRTTFAPGNSIKQ